MMTLKISVFTLVISIGLLLRCNNKESPITPKENIPNSGFENWTTEDNFVNPTDWHTSNFSLYNIVTFNTVSKDSTDPFSGKFCARLETKSQLINGEIVKVAGLITLGTFDINIASREAIVYGGIPINSKPIGLEGYYKYNSVGGDSCFIDITLSTQSKDTIADGRFSSSGKSDWTLFNIPLTYRSEITPQNINIIVLSSDTSIFEPGSTLWVDDLKLKY